MRSQFGMERRREGQFDNLWLVTFADLMVQLMAFFAVVYSYSQLSMADSSSLLKALREELGIKSSSGPHPLGEGKLQGEGILQGTQGLPPDRASDLEKFIADMKNQDGPDEGVKLRVVTLRGSILFDESSSAVKPEFNLWLQRIATLSREYPGFVLVLEGHAAPNERGSNGGDSWALSGERSSAVARKLVSLGMEPVFVIPEARGDTLFEGDATTREGLSLARQVRFRFQRAEGR